MLIFIERLFLGGTFFLLLIFGIILLITKDNILQSPKMHRYLGASIVISGFSFLYMYMEMLLPNSIWVHGMGTAFTIAAVVIYLYIGYRIISLLFERYTLSQPIEKSVDKPAESVQSVTEDKKEGVEAVEETSSDALDEDDKNATDENGDIIPEPSADNMEDMIFFQKLEALMAREKLFSEQEITRERIAAEIGTNRTYLIRSIKFATGMTFNEYITNLRVNYAATLLITTDEPLDYIGTLAGFRSKSAYYRAFTAANDCTPTEYRNRNKE